MNNLDSDLDSDLSEQEIVEHLDRCYFMEWFCSDVLLYL